MDMVVNLPDEILLRILWYLHPVDQISFANACERFKQLTYDKSIVRKVDLSRFSRINAKELISYFSDKARTQNITELNLNDCVWTDRKFSLERSISHCTNLKTLHILHCGLTLSNLCYILLHLPYLTTLSWSMLNDNTNVSQLIKCLTHNYSTKDLHLQQLKALRIELWDTNAHVLFLGYFIRYCKNLEDLHVQLWDRHVIDPFADISSVDCELRNFVLSMPQLSNLVITQGQGELERHQYVLPFKSLSSLQIIIRSIFHSHNPSNKWKTIWISPAATQILITLIDAVTMSGKFDQYDSPSIITTCGYRDAETKNCEFILNLFQKVKSNVIRHLEIQHAFLAPADLKTVARVGEVTLKRLSFYNCIWQPDHEAVQYPLTLLFETCRNITELNLNKCHFKIGDNLCSALAELKSLLRIQLQECGIANEVTLPERADQDEECDTDGVMKRRKVASRPVRISALLPVIEQCPNVVEFDVRGCMEDGSNVDRCCVHLGHKACTDDDLAPLHRWKKLESLTCFNLSYMQQGKFLEYLTENCECLKTLKISKNPNLSAVSTFQMSLYNAIRKAKSLKDIKIQHKFLDLASGLLWKALGDAKKLERICIESNARGSLDVNVIYKLFEDIPQLSVLHIHSNAWNSKKVSKQLKKKVQCIASTRGISIEALIIERPENRLWQPQLKTMHCGHLLHMSELCVFSSKIALPLEY